jgi:hypothetical protein
MAADVVLRARGPGGASPDVKPVGRGAGLVAEANGFEGKLPSTAVRRLGRLGLKQAGERDGPGRRTDCASGARAALCWAVRPSIVVPTSRNTLDRMGPAVNSWGAAETLRRDVRHLPDRGRHPSPPDEPTGSAATPRPFSQGIRPRPRAVAAAGGTGEGSASLQTAARIWQGSSVNRCHGDVTRRRPRRSAHDRRGRPRTRGACHLPRPGSPHAATARRTPKAFSTRSSVSSVGFPLSLNAL